MSRRSKSKAKATAEVDEALLEMHFFRAIVEHFTLRYGATFLRLLKPSRQSEAWVGFDQGWFFSTLSDAEFESSLSAAIASGSNTIDHFYIGFFLQFKVVHKLVYSSDYKPSAFLTPYLRSELDLIPNKTTKLSQHETLIRLSDIANACVSYACPMFFDSNKVYEAANLKDLRCVPLTTAPRNWPLGERHFICFQDPSDKKPLWCSDPVEGLSIAFDEWASPDSKFDPKPMSAEQIRELLTAAAKTSKVKSRKQRGDLPESFILIELERTPTRKPSEDK